jgi:predicted naringenin-chalcone synthase
MTRNSNLLPTMTALSTAVPPLSFAQDEIWDGFFSSWYKDVVPDSINLARQTRVRRRHMAWDPSREIGMNGRGTGDRMKAFAHAVETVASQAVETVLDRVEQDNVSSLVMASCTGYCGPTPDYLVARKLGMRADLRRTFIGHMGCFAAFNVLKTAIDSVTARPNEVTVGLCAEFSSLQFRPEPSREQAVIHALFGDAAAAFSLEMREPGQGPQILATHTQQSYETADMMTWSVLDDGFRMTLSPYVPFVLAGSIEAFVDELCRKAGVEREAVKHWAIHPGGPKIVEMVAQKLGITERQLQATWHVLSEYGNCSSATVLMVLKQLIEADKPQPGELGVMMAFGPGLTMESALVRF